MHKVSNKLITYRLEGTATAADKTKSPFLYLPFEVPERITRLEVSYRFDEGNILDIGLFDSEVRDFPSKRGFRGWSGGARQHFFVATDSATPGYIPGEMPTGNWHIILGLAHVDTAACHYQVDISLDSAERALLASPKPFGTVRLPAGWYCGDLQSHSHHSDAKGSLEDLIAAAKSRKLDFLAVTDHNTVSHHRQLAELNSADLLLIPGEEVTTYRGHANVWGVDDWVDFRVLDDADFNPLIEQVHARGGLFSVNHPKATPNCIGCDWEYEVPNETDCFEAWQGPWLNRNWESLARYDALLRQGRRLTLVGGSDRHQPGWPDHDPIWLQVGSPTTWLHLSELSVKGVLEGLKRGNCFVSEAPAGPKLSIFLNQVPMGGRLEPEAERFVKAQASVHGAEADVLRWVTAEGVVREVLIDADPFIDQWLWEVDSRFVRAEIIACQGSEVNDARLHLIKPNNLPTETVSGSVPAGFLKRALSNPIYTFWRHRPDSNR